MLDDVVKALGNLDKVRPLLSQLLRVAPKSSGAAVFFLCLTVAHPFVKEEPQLAPIKTAIFPTLAALLSGLFAMVALSKYAKVSDSVQIIAWEGWDRAVLYPPSQKPSMILYEGGFHSLPRLKYRSGYRGTHSPFDLLVTDMLYLDLYKNRLQGVDVHAGIPDHVKKLNALARQATIVPNGYRNHRLGLPVEFGFSELLINPSHFNGTSIGDRITAHHAEIAKGTSLDNPALLNYNELRLKEVLAQTSGRIGVWNWYIPALLHLLALNQSGNGPVALNTISTATGTDVQLVCELIAANIDRFVFIDSLGDLTKHAMDGDLVMILGAGSSCLPYGGLSSSRLRPVIPREGVFCWVNCVGILPERDSVGFRSVIDHWMTDACQAQICLNPVYRSLPVTQEAFLKICSDGTHPARLATDFLFNHGNLKDPAKVVFRKLPTAWRQWQEHWDNLQVSVLHHQ